MSGWIILRTSAASTLGLARSLSEGGIATWAPEVMRRRTRSRSTKYVDGPSAVLPSYVFADSDRLTDLLAMSEDELTRHPAFTIHKHNGAIPVVADAGLEPLREFVADCDVRWAEFVEAQRIAEAKRNSKRKRKRKGRDNPRRAYVLGQRVRVLDAAFDGMEGQVTGCLRNGNLVIVFGSGFEIEVDACDAAPVHVECA